MNKILQDVKRLARMLFYYFYPSPLPVGMTEFDAWAESIIQTYKLPDNDTAKYALATMIINKGPKVCFVPKYQFFLEMKASMAKQVAGGVFRDITEKHKAAEAAAKVAAAAEAQKQAEATATPVASGT